MEEQILSHTLPNSDACPSSPNVSYGLKMHVRMDGAGSKRIFEPAEWSDCAKDVSGSSLFALSTKVCVGALAQGESPQG
jgi:hypothetical protein